MKKILSLLHINLPLLVSTVVVLLMLNMLMKEGFTSLVLFLIATLVFLEVYFTSIVHMMLHIGRNYPFVRFIGHLSSFAFLTMFLFGLMFSSFGNEHNYLLNTVEKSMMHGFETAFYFSGVTLLSIGYGDIIPYGFFRVISIFESFIGSFIILSFFSVGLSHVFLSLHKNLKQEQKILKKEKKIIEEEKEIIEEEKEIEEEMRKIRTRKKKK